MTTAPVLRILRLRPARVGFDGVLRAALPTLPATAGLLDVAVGRGPCALYLARLPTDPGRFVTISTWSDWAAIEAATGGDIRRPVATRHPERLVAWEATHFESLEIPG